MTVSAAPASSLLGECGQRVWTAPRRFAMLLLHGYRRFISPLYGDVCRFYPTCSAYSLEAYERRGFVVGTALTIWRLVRCQPFTAGGVDPVPHGRHDDDENTHCTRD